MSLIDDVIIEPLENAFDAVGAMDGELAPLKRMAIGAAVGYGFLKVFQPSVAYTADGKERPFALADANAPDGTYLPWWMIVAIPAAVSSILI